MSIWDDSWGYQNDRRMGASSQVSSGRMKTSRGEAWCANTRVPSPLTHHMSLQPTGDGRMPTIVDAPSSAPQTHPTLDPTVTIPGGEG